MARLGLDLGVEDLEPVGASSEISVTLAVETLAAVRSCADLLEINCSLAFAERC